ESSSKYTHTQANHGLYLGSVASRQPIKIANVDNIWRQKISWNNASDQIRLVLDNKLLVISLKGVLLAEYCFAQEYVKILPLKDSKYIYFLTYLGPSTNRNRYNILGRMNTETGIIYVLPYQGSDEVYELKESIDGHIVISSPSKVTIYPTTLGK
ncbi:MAG: hypothetical protein Q8N36_03340, partial [bacterium]|nr:hypothetical protein [bacterium]